MTTDKRKPGRRLTDEEAADCGLLSELSPRKPGRPALPPGEKLVVVPVRLTEAQKAKLQRIGVQRLRDWLDRVREQSA
jgi:hypothetical protein